MRIRRRARSLYAGPLAGALALTLAAAPTPAAAASTYVAVPSGGVVATITSLTFAGNYAYATSYGAGTVVRMRVLPGGLLGPGTPLVTNLDAPLGVAVGPDGTLYVADSHPGPGTSTVGRVRAIPATGGDAAAVGQVVVDGLPNGRHNTNNLVVHDGRLYITNGNSTDDGVTGGAAERPLSGTVLSVALSARNVAPVESADLVVEAKGLRNAYDVAFRPGTGELWATSNGPDRLDPWGEDLLHKLAPASEVTVDFGFPACIYRGTTAGPVFTQNPAIATPCTAASHRAPEATLGLHVSANGLDFAPTTNGWDGALYIAEYGSNGVGAQGHAIVRVPVDAAGNAGTPASILASPTPLDLAFGPGGLYVGDFGSGVITLVRPVA